MSEPGTLPSSEHASEFLAAPTAQNAAQLALDLAGRALLIGIGMSLLAPRARTTTGRALAGSAAIEVFVLAYTASLAKKPK